MSFRIYAVGFAVKTGRNLQCTSGKLGVLKSTIVRRSRLIVNLRDRDLSPPNLPIYLRSPFRFGFAVSSTVDVGLISGFCS